MVRTLRFITPGTSTISTLSAVSVQLRQTAAPSALLHVHGDVDLCVDKLRHVNLHGLGCWNLPHGHIDHLVHVLAAFSGISNLRNFDLLDHVIDFSPGWSDSLSLHFHPNVSVLLHLHVVLDMHRRLIGLVSP